MKNIFEDFDTDLMSIIIDNTGELIIVNDEIIELIYFDPFGLNININLNYDLGMYISSEKEKIEKVLKYYYKTYPLSDELFVKFLNENEIYSQFIKNSNNFIINKVSNINKKPSPEYYFFDAFLWEKTTEEFIFWNIIHTKWIIYLKEKKIKIENE
jgi:hypothetical protein